MRLNLISVYRDIQLLTGIGEEWYINQNGESMVFIDGNIRSDVICQGYDHEITLAA